MRRNLHNMKKSSRVADENILTNENGAELPIVVDRRMRSRGWNNWLSVLYGIARVPTSLLSCLSHPRMNAIDGVWVSSELAQTPEVNHLLVRDSMRYAIFM
ncbi:unnamed protein product [Fraxinus pennsylvanica]|uniref:Uncharacterized protein n=1 Tax=Fraxinus pennsylvanica TaxID=56036 RepID=A0AAD2A676_9LAMI|nr:unnamed protein product [Fraxinus pennsylvanica]